MISCSLEHYLDSAQFLKVASHSLACIAIPVNLFGLFVIYSEKSIKMQQLKYILLTTHIWGMISDLVLGTFMIPYILFPTLSGAPLGLMNYLGVPPFVQLYIGTVCIAEFACSLVLLFENRQNSIVRSRLKITRKTTRVFFYAFNYGLPLFLTIIMFVDIPDQMAAHKNLLKYFPCPPTEYFTLPLIHPSENPILIGAVFTILSSVYFIEGVFFITHSIYHLSTYSLLSKNTKALQRKFFEVVSIQIMIAVIVFLSPVGYFSYSMFTGYFNQKLSNFGIVIMSIHGFICTIVLLILYDAYRHETLKLFAKFRLYKTNSILATTSIVLYRDTTLRYLK